MNQSSPKCISLPELNAEVYYFPNLRQPFPPHFHDALMLGCLLKGCREVEYAIGRHLLKAGECEIVPARASIPASQPALNHAHGFASISGVSPLSQVHQYQLKIENSARSSNHSPLSRLQSLKRKQELPYIGLMHCLSPHAGRLIHRPPAAKCLSTKITETRSACLNSHNPKSWINFASCGPSNPPQALRHIAIWKRYALQEASICCAKARVSQSAPFNLAFTISATSIAASRPG